MIIKNIKSFAQIYLLTASFNRSFFSNAEKINTLKTYLQIIPPHQLYQIVENKQHRLENLIKTAQNSSNTQVQVYEKEGRQKVYKNIYKHIKKNSQYVPIPQLSKVMEVVCAQIPNESPEQYEVRRKTYLKILKQVKYKADSIPLEDLVNFIYRLAKLNKHEYEIMKAAQSIIIQEPLKINFPILRKILWAYTHLDIGSSVLYNHISKTLRIGQNQIQPLQLAEAAYMLSKVSDNARGGHGIFQIAEKHLQNYLPRLDFNGLAKAASYMLTQNIGTNQFQIKLQTQIYQKYPSKDQLHVKDLVVLLKATSGYYFKFNQNALLNMLKTSTEREAKNATLQQFQDMLWSWGRMGKGDKQLWECLQQQVKRRIKYLKPRQIAFFYYSLSQSSHFNLAIIQLLQKQFLQNNLSEINEHYLIKMILGMQKRKAYNQELFIKFSALICQRIEKLSKNELISFLKSLNQSDYDYTNKKPIEDIIQALIKAGKKLSLKLYTLKISQITQLLYLYIKLQISDPELIKNCFMSISQTINIPKSCFIKALFCFTIKDNYEKSYQMITILEQLLNYGPIGYFFSPYQFPLLAYSIIHMNYNSRGEIQINKVLVGQTVKALKQLNPIILNDFVKKGYTEALRIVQNNQKKRNNQ